MERKGLSQILYLIIAASVLMMVAMIVTFTATDVIGGLGATATDSQCQDALVGTCQSLTGTTSGDAVTQLPSSCIDTENNQFLTTESVYNTADNARNTASTVSQPNSGGSQPYYVNCANTIN